MICMTPLYHFSSDSHELLLSEGIRIVALDDYVGPSFDEEVGKYLAVYEPPYILFSDPLLSGNLYFGAATSSRFPARLEAELNSILQEKGGVKEANELQAQFLYGTMKLLTLLRLFKPGRLRAGETFFISSDGTNQIWNTFGSGRASSMVVDYHRLADQTTSYVLRSDDVPFFSTFMQNLTPFIVGLGSFPALETALQIYGADNGPYLEAVEVVTALEALITKKEEVEGLTYRLGMRAANLLGRDADERKNIFRQVKQFYGLRSRIVHGAELDDKLTKRLDELETMRELLRRVLLCVMALTSNGKKMPDIPDLIDELAFDEERRRQVQETASGFLHM